MDGLTPAGMAPGSVAGSYALSGLDNVNLFSGNLSFALPLHRIGGRGEAGYTIRLHIERDWTAKKEERVDAPGQYYVNMFPSQWEALGVNGTPEIGLNAGFTMLRQLAIRGSEPCSIPVLDIPGTRELTISRVSVLGPDGSEHALSGGMASVRCTTGNGLYDSVTPTRSTFVSTDGSRLWLHLDEPVADIEAQGGYRSLNTLGWLTGRLVSGDGVTYRLDAGRVTWIQDRNGNVVEVTYPDGSGPHEAPSLIRDSLGRETTIHSGESQVVIRFDGAEGAERTIRILRGNLSEALAPGESVRTHGELFPRAASDMSAVEHARRFEGPVVTAVMLPDGRQYSFTYTSYGKLKQVALPTGGAIVYDYYDVEYDTVSAYTAHRIQARRVYDEQGQLVQEATYAYGDVAGGSTTTVVTTGDGGVLSDVLHTFHGGRREISDAFATNSGRQGREYRTEDRPLRTQTMDWEDRSLGPVVTATVTRLEDGSESRSTYAYDSFNNQTLATDYDYGGSAIRTRCTSFAADGGYTGDPVHLVSLPQREAVYEGAGGGAGCPNSGALRALTTYGYDETELTGRPDLTGSDPTFGETRRGNATTITRWGSQDGNVVTRREYDVAGNVVAVQDGRGKWTTIGYDDRWGIQDDAAGTSGTSTYAYPTSVTNALGHTSYTRYDFGTGLVVQQQDVNGVRSELSYQDELDRLTGVVRAANTSERSRTLYDYDDASRRITASSDLTSFGDGLLRTMSAYDGLGRLVRTEQSEDDGAVVVERRYDGLGRLFRVSNPSRGAVSKWTTTGYDRLSRPRSVVTPDGATTVTAYTGPDTSVTDPAGKARASRVDALGRMVRVTEGSQTVAACPSGNTTCYSYDTLDNLRTVTQDGQTRSFVYDSLSQLRSATNPESGTIGYQEYDGNGNLLRRQDARGIVTTYTYDDLNRIKSRSYSSLADAVSYDYDVSAGYGKGRLTRVSAGLSTRTIGVYSPSGRVLSQTQNTNGRDYRTFTVYNLAGMPILQSYPSDRVVTTDYNSAGQVQGVTSVGPGSTSTVYFVVPGSARYAPHGGVTRVRRGNGILEQGDFNDRLQRTYIDAIDTNLEPNVTQLHLQFGYEREGTGNNGNVLSQEIGVGGGIGRQTYFYDSRNRLSHVEESFQGTPIWGQTFQYDSHGNRRVAPGSFIPMPSVALTPTVEGDIDSATNRITMGSAYDGAGNLASDAVGRLFEYDAENRLVSFRAAGRLVEYAYDGDGRRVIKQESDGVTSVYAYDGEGRLLTEHSDADALRPARDFIYAGSQLVGEVKSWMGSPGGPMDGNEFRIAPGNGEFFNQVMPFRWRRRPEGAATYKLVIQTPQGGPALAYDVPASIACPPAGDECQVTIAELGRKLYGVIHHWKLTPAGEQERPDWWKFYVIQNVKGPDSCFKAHESCASVCDGMPAPCDAPCQYETPEGPVVTISCYGWDREHPDDIACTTEYTCAQQCQHTRGGSCYEECPEGTVSQGRMPDCNWAECCYDPNVPFRCSEFAGASEFVCSTTASCPSSLFEPRAVTGDCAMCCVSRLGQSCQARGGACTSGGCPAGTRNLGQTASCQSCCKSYPPDSCEWVKGGECRQAGCLQGYADLGTTSDCPSHCCSNTEQYVLPSPDACYHASESCASFCSAQGMSGPPCDAPCMITSPVYTQTVCGAYLGTVGGYCNANTTCQLCAGIGTCAPSVDAPCPDGTSSGGGRRVDCQFGRCCI